MQSFASCCSALSYRHDLFFLLNSLALQPALPSSFCNEWHFKIGIGVSLPFATENCAKEFSRGILIRPLQSGQCSDESVRYFRYPDLLYRCVVTVIQNAFSPPASRVDGAHARKRACLIAR